MDTNKREREEPVAESRRALAESRRALLDRATLPGLQLVLEGYLQAPMRNPRLALQVAAEVEWLADRQPALTRCLRIREQIALLRARIALCAAELKAELKAEMQPAEMQPGELVGELASGAKITRRRIAKAAKAQARRSAARDGAKRAFGQKPNKRSVRKL